MRWKITLRLANEILVCKQQHSRGKVLEFRWRDWFGRNQKLVIQPSESGRKSLFDIFIRFVSRLVSGRQPAFNTLTPLLSIFLREDDMMASDRLNNLTQQQLTVAVQQIIESPKFWVNNEHIPVEIRRQTKQDILKGKWGPAPIFSPYAATHDGYSQGR